MSNFVCPLCSTRFSEDEYLENLKYHKSTCSWTSNTDLPYISYYCKHYDRSLAIESKIYRHEYEQETTERLLDLAAEHLIRQEYCMVDGEKHIWHFYYDPNSDEQRPAQPEYINLAPKMREYPTHAIDVAHRALLNMAAKHPYYGHQFSIQSDDHRIGFDRTAYISGKLGFIPLLIDFQYIHAEAYRDCHLCTITALGWQKVEELRKQEQTVRQGFVAMAFRQEAKPIRESFRRAIRDAGYYPVILDEKEHNNQIVPEIFYEIRRSKFVVVDVTYPNYGAYYEAGYAQALGKQVIICCREDVYNDSSKQPHFDIAQQSIIVWKDHEDLVRRLKRRIEVTVQ